MKIGILREEKIPRDTRVPLTPSQCRRLMEEHPELWIAVQPSEHRCYTNDEYRWQGVPVREDLSGCDYLFGVKEIPVSHILAHKTYLIFSHTIKEQLHNQKMLQTFIEKKATLIDYECLKDENGKRIIAFGRWAGIVGAYHALRMIGIRWKKFQIRQMRDCLNFAEAQKELAKVQLPPIKIVLSGSGRVSEGADFLLQLAKIKKVSPNDLLKRVFPEPVYAQLQSQHLFYREGMEAFDREDYHRHPQLYKSAFYPFTKVTDVFINGIYWDKRIPVFFTKEQMKESGFRIRQIADITCDIAPNSSVPSTLKASSIDDPYYGYDPHAESITDPFTEQSIDVMAIDNLPNELPRDASEDFGNLLISRVIPKILAGNHPVIQNATIVKNGVLTTTYEYLKHYAGIY
jgi:alanine dehydrogenase